MRWWQRVAREVVAAIGGGLIAGIVPRVQRNGEIERGIDVLTTEAQRQIGLQYDTGSAQDVKTIGIIAAASAGAALFIPAEHQVSALWALPLLVLAASAYCLVRSLLHRAFERGPQVPDLYRHFEGTLIEAKETILQELVRALEQNQPLLRYKVHWYRWGLLFVALAIVATALVQIALVLPV